jgi:hypothetical protein
MQTTEATITLTEERLVEIVEATVSRALGAHEKRVGALVDQAIAERSDQIAEAVEDALESPGLIRAIEEARGSGRVSREEVMAALREGR